MARPLRLEIPGAWWHVTNRGVEKRDLFLNDDDRWKFLDLIAETVPDASWRLHAYVLMNNHFHLFIETPEPTLSDGMKQLEESYAARFNKKWTRVGHLFQGRFKACVVDSERYLLNVARYVVLNPVRATLTRTPGEWPWCSYRATAGVVEAPPWLTISAVLGWFDPEDSARARVEYCRFIGDPAAADERIWDKLVDGFCLGDTEFVARVNDRIVEERKKSGNAIRPIIRNATLEMVRDAVTSATGEDIGKNSPTARAAFADLARSETRAKLDEIAATLRIGRDGVGYLARQSKQRRKTDPKFAAMIERVRVQIRTNN